MNAEYFVRGCDGPVYERRFLEISDPVEPRGDPVAGREHVASDLSLHAIHVVKNPRRRSDATEVHGAGDEQNRQDEVRTLPVSFWAWGDIAAVWILHFFIHKNRIIRPHRW